MFPSVTLIVQAFITQTFFSTEGCIQAWLKDNCFTFTDLTNSAFLTWCIQFDLIVVLTLKIWQHHFFLPCSLYLYNTVLLNVLIFWVDKLLWMNFSFTLTNIHRTWNRRCQRCALATSMVSQLSPISGYIPLVTESSWMSEWAFVTLWRLRFPDRSWYTSPSCSATGDSKELSEM